jgi:hypothetical protein
MKKRKTTGVLTQKDVNNEGHKAYNYEYGWHPAPTGPALPNLINAVRMLKSKSTIMLFWLRRDKHVDFDFKILTALKGWVGHAPQGRGALHIHNYNYNIQ